MTALPKYKGWSVDCRLKEFRKVKSTKRGPSMKTIPFDSDRGDRMLASAIKGRLGNKLIREGCVE